MHDHDLEIGATDIIELDDSSPMVCPSCGTLCELTHKYCPGCGFPMEKLREQPEDPLVGCTLPGGHVVLELIDVGGMGRVYRAEQKMLGRTVAVKIIHPHLLGDETVEARFITEARAASQLNHPNSVGVIDFGKFEGRLYMVMEYIRGRDLATVAHEEGPLDIERVVDIVCQSLAALEEAHAVGIIHRDLKPENIVLSPLRSGGDFVKVLDFGLAKVLQESTRGHGNKRITDPGMVCGTPEYMAPEQARGEDIDRRTDLYACGVLLYELVAGQLPFEGNNPREVVLMHLSKPPPELSVVAPQREVPPALIDVIYKALSKKPGDRYQSASEFTRALRESVEEKEAPAAETIECQSCGAEMPVAQKFCGECGSRMGTSQLPPEPTAAPTTASVAPPPGEALPFVGRDDELGWLFERRDEASQSLVACELVGHAGAGKTRLLQEFCFNADHWGDRVVVVGPDPWWAGQGFHALRHAIRHLADLPADGGSPAQWPAASPEVRVGLNAIFGREADDRAPHRRRRRWSETPPLDSGEGNLRMLVAEALRWALSRAQTLADGGNVVLTVDDLHAVDGASRNAFLDVVLEPPLVPAMLICSHRPSFDSGWEGAERLEVRGLPTSVAASLLGGRDSQTPADDHDDRRVSPMYVDQLRRFTAEGGDDPPSKLADLIALRIERLPAGARRLLQALAVRGDATTSSQLQSILPEEEALLEFLPELEDAGFVDQHDGLIRCTHPLVRDVAMAGTPAGVRKMLHARVRRNTGDGPALPLEADAVHAYNGELSFEALMLLERVASEASGRDDPEGAVRALRMAMEMARREMSRGELDDPVSAVLMFSCKLGDALCTAGKPMDAEGVLSEALNLAGPASVERSRILASFANAARHRDRPDLAFERLDEAVAIAERGKHDDLLDTLDRMRSRWVQGLS